MKQGPDRGITKAQIELLHLFFGKENGVRLELHQGILNDAFSERFIDAAARPAYPQMFAGERRVVLARLLKRGESGDQTARARLKRHAIAIDAEIERQAVGNDDQSSPAQVWTICVLLRRTFSHEETQWSFWLSVRIGETKSLGPSIMLLPFI